MFTTSKRTFFGMGIEVVWVVVLAALSPVAYLIKRWRELRLFIFIFISVLTVLSFFLLQESIRWLISVEQIKKAERIVNRIIRYNRIEKTDEFKKGKAELERIFSDLDAYNKAQNEAKNEIYHNQVDSLLFSLYLTVPEIHWIFWSIWKKNTIKNFIFLRIKSCFKI